MPKIEWNPSFSCQEETIDQQHQTWFAMLNALHDALVSGSTETISDTKDQTLEAMKVYVREHFRYEEAYMEHIGCTGLAEHRRIHARYYGEISNLHNEFRAGELILSTRVIKELRRWLVDHILEEDQKYVRFARMQESCPSG